MIYKLEIIPKSTFLTYPKGDMIFGFFYYWWKKFEKGDLIIDDKPKVVFSDFLPKGYFPKPALPIRAFADKEVIKEKRKNIKSVEWVEKEDLENLKNIGDYEKFNFFKVKNSVKNHLNKITFTTDEGGFSPFVLREIEFLYSVEMYVYVDGIDIDEVKNFLNKIGEFGFGRKSGIGKGIFEVGNSEKVELKEGNVYLSLSPFITSKKSFYSTFSRFGKYHYTSKPYKNPVVLMDRGSVVFEECKEIEGEVIENSISNKQSILNAYSIMIPFNLKENYEN